MLSGKAIIVTGASGGIGAAIARRCALLGARVGVHYKSRKEPAEKLAREVQGTVLSFDVTNSAQIEQGLSTFVAQTGRLDGWVNAAGVHYASLLINADEAKLAEQLSVNLLGTILCTRAALPTFLQARRGVVLNLSSVAAQSPVPGGAAYAASKAGVEAFTRGIALEYGKKGIRALCVRPGPTQTPMLAAALALGGDAAAERTALKRLATPEEVAGLCSYLLSDDASYITGSVHGVDGGYT